MKMLTHSIICLTLSLAALQAFAQCEPLFGKLVINEVMAGNDNTATDENGDYDDWVEIHNTTNENINLNGYFLSDNNGNKTKYAFPDVDIDANGYMIIWCDDEIDQGDFHAPFKLSGSGEEVGLYNPDTTSIDYMRFPAIPDDISMGRFPDGRGPFKILIPTFNAANTNTVDIGLVINEYQAINETTASDQFGGFEDWVEIYNNSNQPISLNGYFLSDKISEPTQYTFPDTTLSPDSYMIIWCDQGLMEPGLHTFFKLGSDGDDILLSNADTITVDYVRFGPQIPDDSEGRFPNGTGPITCLIPTFTISNVGVTGVFDFEKPEILALWPNPAEDYFWVNCTKPQGAILRVFDIAGRQMLQKRLRSGDNRIGTEDFTPGFYSVTAENRTAKIVIH